MFELAGHDRAGIVADVAHLLTQNGCNVRSAAVRSWRIVVLRSSSLVKVALTARERVSQQCCLRTRAIQGCAQVWTYRSRVAVVLSVTHKGQPIQDALKLQRLQQMLFDMMDQKHQGIVTIKTVSCPFASLNTLCSQPLHLQRAFCKSLQSRIGVRDALCRTVLRFCLALPCA